MKILMSFAMYCSVMALAETVFLDYGRWIRGRICWIDVLLYLFISGTFEQSSEAEEDIYEVINIGKIKAHTPNLRIVNLYGITFIDDSHIELFASNCIHIQCLALNFCLRVKGSSFKLLLQRCKKLKTLLLQHAGTGTCSYIYIIINIHLRNINFFMLVYI